MTLRDLERDSIRAFVQSAADDGYLSGRVLDYGCGKQPYRDIVEATGGEYHGYDRTDLPASVATEDYGTDPLFWNGMNWDAVLCTQVIQYLPMPGWQLGRTQMNLDPSQGPAVLDGPKHPEQPGHLVLTYPTNWPEVEPEDLHRFTKAGMERLLTEAGFEIVRHEERAKVRVAARSGALHDDEFALGYGVIARA